jgi:hypothetical protein
MGTWNLSDQLKVLFNQTEITNDEIFLLYKNERIPVGSHVFRTRIKFSFLYLNDEGMITKQRSISLQT